MNKKSLAYSLKNSAWAQHDDIAAIRSYSVVALLLKQICQF